MTINASTFEDYLNQIPEDRRETFQKLRDVINKNIPKGFVETINYAMPSWVVPHNLYPKGYHCTPALPLPFVSIASQKNFIAFYHMGMYADNELLEWFLKEYPKHSSAKLDMGKSCIRFKKTNQIPIELLGEFMSKMTPEEWINLYEKAFKVK